MPELGPRTLSPGRFGERDVRIPAGEVMLDGTLAVPPRLLGVVVFAHGSGSGRFSPRNRFVADQLRTAGLGTLLADLLTGAEEEVDRLTREFRFDIPRLAGRVVALLDWLDGVRKIESLPLGLFGASTGAAAALIAAAERPDRVAAVVSRGGRPDLAGPRLREVRAPTLLIVGGLDTEVIDLNRQAQASLRCPNVLEIVPGATHLFEEPGKLEEVARLAREWFEEKF